MLKCVINNISNVYILIVFVQYDGYTIIKPSQSVYGGKSA